MELDRILTAIKCCSAAVRCHQCPYNKYRMEEGARNDDCQKMLMRDLCAEIEVDSGNAWWNYD